MQKALWVFQYWPNVSTVKLRQAEIEYWDVYMVMKKYVLNSTAVIDCLDPLHWEPIERKNKKVN